jgi:hypothetical protein
MSVQESNQSSFMFIKLQIVEVTSNLKMEATFSSETFVTTYKTTRHHTPLDSDFNPED